jgi:hypothetical protein
MSQVNDLQMLIASQTTNAMLQAAEDRGDAAEIAYRTSRGPADGALISWYSTGVYILGIFVSVRFRPPSFDPAPIHSADSVKRQSEK